MKKCLNCGAEFRDDSLNFCDCGGPLVRLQQTNESKGYLEEGKGVNPADEDEVEAFLESLDENFDEIGEDDPLRPSEEDDEIERTYDDVLEDAPESVMGNEICDYNAVRNYLEDDTDESEPGTDVEEIAKSLEESDIQSLLEDLFGEDVVIDKPEEASDLSRTPNVEREVEVKAVTSDWVPSENHEISEIAETTDAEEKEPKPAARPITSGIWLTLYRRKNVVARHELWYDEILIGRSRTGADVDINLRDVDDEKLTSRRHAKIYRENGAYYIQRLSQKAPVWVRGKFLELGESVQLYDGDKVILSNCIGFVVRNLV